MINTDLQDILGEENISEALENLGKKNDSCGNDGVMLSDMSDYWRINGSRIRKEILENEYSPGVVKNVEIVNYQGKIRTITLFNSIDRLIMRAVIQRIQPECEKLMPSCCYAFRQGIGVQDAILKACEYMSEGNIYIAKTDIKGFFDNIQLGKMCSMINTLFSDKGLKKLLKKFLFLKVDEGGKISEKKRGIIQGSAISPLLSNLYLLAFDEYMTKKAYRYIRYSDDIAVFTEDISTAECIYSEIYTRLKQDFSLDVNEKKSGVFEGVKQVYLGYRFEQNKKTKTVTAVKNRRAAEFSYRSWHCDCIKKTDRNYHIVNDGILTKRDYTVLFENETGKYYIPVETTKAINIYSDITFSSNFFRFMSGKNLCVNMFDKFGNYEGSFHGSRSSYNAKAMLGQAALYLDEDRRIEVVRAMIIAYIHNMRANLRYYLKKGRGAYIEECVDKLSEIIKDVNKKGKEKFFDSIMLCEGRARQMYYSAFNEIITDNDFVFTSRTRRPPKDPLNAMISFGNTYLYNRIATEIYKSSLDIRIGIVHSTNSRRQSLNLDIADIFKPIIVDRTIFKLINKRMIDVKNDFQTVENGGVYLSRSGKRIFINHLDSKVYDKFTDNGVVRTYDSKIRDEVNKIFRMVTYGEKYKPYKYY